MNFDSERRGSLKAAGRTVNRKVFQRGRREGNVKLAYSWEADCELGAGAFGKVFRAKSVHDPKKVVAVKQVNKNACDDLEELWKEIGLLEEIDHPHILRFFEAYEDYRTIYIITELCLGGDVLHFLHEVIGNITFASRLTSEVLNALAFCHSKGFCHRDLKLDNILLLRRSTDSPIRVADFGLASQVQEVMCKESVKRAHIYAQAIGRREDKKTPTETAINASKPETVSSYAKRRNVRLKSFKGTPEYMAPEVLAVLNSKVNNTGETTFYDFRCDVWSLGVVVHALLVGKEPYTLEEVAAYVENEAPLNDLVHVDDNDAEEFLKRCLVADYEERPTTAELLRDDAWVRRFERKVESNQDDNLMRVREKLHTFTDLSHFKRAALTAAARHLSPFEQEELRCLFTSIDTGRTGTITLQELRDALHRKGSDSGKHANGVENTQDWIIRAFAAMDTDLSGEVDYTEFLAAVMDSHIENRKDLAWAAFRAFDLDGSGMISRQELSKVLEDAELQQLLEQVAHDHVLRKNSSLSGHNMSPNSEGSRFGMPQGNRKASIESTLTNTLSINTKDTNLSAPALTPVSTPSLRKLAELRFESEGVDQLMQVADKNGDGEISFEEFLELLKLDTLT